MKLSLRTRANLAAVLFLAALIFSESTAAEADKGLTDLRPSEFISKSEPVYFSGNKFNYNSKAGIVTGTGDIEIVQDANELRGDSITIDLTNKTAEMKGHVVAAVRGVEVEGTKGEYNFENQTGVFYEARGHSNPWYFSADEIDREASGEYEVASAGMTTCNLEHPHYRLQAGTLTIIPEKRVVARNLTLFADSVPVFWLPYYSQGLGPSAPPFEFDAGNQNDIGAFIRVGYNLELSKEVTLTPYLRAFTKSGVGAGLNGNLKLFEGEGTGWFDTFYIHDLNSGNTDEPGIPEDRGTAYVFYRQQLPYDFTGRVRAEYNSDSEFLKTFYWDKYSEREAPRSYFNLERTGEHSVVSFLVQPRLVDYIEAVERLPQLRLDLLEQRLGDTGFFFSAENAVANLNIDPEGPHSARNFSEARLAYPLRLLDSVEFVPFIEGDATYYSETLDEDSEYRFSWNPGVAAQTHVERIFGSLLPRYYTAFRHLMVPTVTYNFRPTPNVEPDELPQFDQIDTVNRENMLEVELLNYLQAKKPDGNRVELMEYRLDTQFEFDDGQDKLAQMENDLWIRPLPNWELALKSLNDYRDESRTDTLSAVVRYTRPEKFKVSAGVIHEDTLLQPYDTQLVYSLSTAFGSLWRAGFEQRYDFSTDDFSYQEFWLWRDLHCMEMLVTFRDRREATSFMILFNIKAFPMRRIDRRIAIKPLEEKHPWPTHW